MVYKSLKLIRCLSPPKIIIRSSNKHALCPSRAQGRFITSFVFIKDYKLSLFLFRLDPKDLIEFLKASVVGELISKFYFYSSDN